MAVKTLSSKENCSLCNVEFPFLEILSDCGEYKYCSIKCKETDEMIDAEDYYKDQALDR